MGQSEKPQNRQESGKKTGFRGPSPDVGKATQFKPGNNANPGGRPKRKWLTDVTEELLEEMLSDPVQREQYKDSLRQKLLSQRVVGAMTLDKIWERTEGKVSQPVEMNINLALADRLERARKRKK